MIYKMPGRNPMSNWQHLLLPVLLWLGANFVTIESSAQEGRPLPDFYTRPGSILNPQALTGDTVPLLIPDTTRLKVPPLAFAVQVGTKGFAGAEIAFNLKPHVHVRLGGSYFMYTQEETRINLGDDVSQELLAKGEIAQNNIELLVEYGFLKDRLRVVGGAVYYLNNSIAGEGILSDNINYEDVIITPEEVGFIKGDIAFKNTIAPYIGLGVGRAIPQKRFGVSGDFGAIFRGRPDVMLEATNLLRNNVDNEKVIEDGLAFFQWWPVVSLRLAVKLF